ncbi:MAG: RNA 2',3'-cyclic phosphodiesterase [Candidatus Binatia bacterium]
MIRAFVAVRISPEVADKIFEVQAELKRQLDGIRWVERENLHFTLKFLGAVGEDKIAPIIAALERAAGAVRSFSIKARGIGVFPDIRRARVLWAGLDGKDLATLAQGVEAAFEPLGFPREKRTFTPHLTLGRWRDPVGQSDKLRHEIESWKDYEFGVSVIEEVILFRSVLKPQGAVYSPLRVVHLSSDEPR